MRKGVTNRACRLAAITGATFGALNLCSPRALAQAGTDPPAGVTSQGASSGGANDLRAMDTDRPNKTNSPHTIDAGHVQIEVGAFDWTYSGSHAGMPWQSQAVFGQTNVRVGVLDVLELNVVVSPVSYSDSGPDSGGERSRATGFGDMVVGGKVNLWGNAGGDSVWATGLAVQPQVKLPTAPDELGNGHTEAFVGVPFLVNLPEGFHLGAQPTVAWERNADNTDDHVGWQFAVSVDRVLFDAVDVYVEYWTHFAEGQEPQHSIDVGCSYPLSEHCVVDTGVNLGLNDATPDVEWTAGVSFKF
jgi:hypothetical protein